MIFENFEVAFAFPGQFQHFKNALGPFIQNRPHKHVITSKNLLRKTKKEYFENINVKDTHDNRKFWMTIKPFFSNKGLNTNKLMIIEKNNLISKESVLANMKNQYFTSIPKQPNLKKDITICDHIHIIIEKIKSSNNTQSELLTFNLVSSDEIKRKILILNNRKASREGDIPVNILKDAIDNY